MLPALLMSVSMCGKPLSAKITSPSQILSRNPEVTVISASVACPPYVLDTNITSPESPILLQCPIYCFLPKMASLHILGKTIKLPSDSLFADNCDSPWHNNTCCQIISVESCWLHASKLTAPNNGGSTSEGSHLGPNRLFALNTLPKTVHSVLSLEFYHNSPKTRGFEGKICSGRPYHRAMLKLEKRETFFNLSSVKVGEIYRLRHMSLCIFFSSLKMLAHMLWFKLNSGFLNINWSLISFQYLAWHLIALPWTTASYRWQCSCSSSPSLESYPSSCGCWNMLIAVEGVHREQMTNMWVFFRCNWA